MKTERMITLLNQIVDYVSNEFANEIALNELKKMGFEYQELICNFGFSKEELLENIPEFKDAMKVEQHHVKEGIINTLSNYWAEGNLKTDPYTKETIAFQLDSWISDLSFNERLKENILTFLKEELLLLGLWKDYSFSEYIFNLKMRSCSDMEELLDTIESSPDSFSSSWLSSSEEAEYYEEHFDFIKKLNGNLTVCVFALKEGKPINITYDMENNQYKALCIEAGFDICNVSFYEFMKEIFCFIKNKKLKLSFIQCFKD